MSVIIEEQSKFLGVELESASLEGRFDEIRTQIRTKFTLDGIDVEQSIRNFARAIEGWKNRESAKNPLAKKSIEYFSSELTRKLYKHALKNQILKMTHVLTDYRKNLSGQLSRVETSLQDFTVREAEFRESRGHLNRKRTLEFLSNHGLDIKSMQGLFDSTSQEFYQDLLEGLNLIQKIAQRNIDIELPVRVEKLEGRVEKLKQFSGDLKGLLKAAKALDEVFAKALDKKLDKIASEWLEVGDAAYNAPLLRKEGIERLAEARAQYSKIPKHSRTSKDARESIKQAEAVLVEFRAIQQLFKESGELYMQMNQFAPYLGWNTSVSDLEKSLELDMRLCSLFCTSMGREIEILEQFEPRPVAVAPVKIQPRASVERIVEEPQKVEAPKEAVVPKTRWQRFCDFWSGIAAAIRNAFTACKLSLA